MRRTIGLGLALTAACGAPDPRHDQEGSATTSADADGEEAEATESTEAESESGDPPEVLCSDIDVPLVLDPRAPIFDESSRAALAGTFDALVQETGATVRIRPNAGTELYLDTACGELLGHAAGEQVLTWGSSFAPDPRGRDALDCVLDAAAAWESPVDSGDWMFSGLMFPLLFTEGWPTAEAESLVTLPMLLADTDDELENMYSRPGMASESLLRNVVDGDRRRAATFTLGDGEDDELELFALTLGKTSLHVDHDERTLAEGLEQWTPIAVQACADHDLMPPDVLPEGCTRLDVLFVVDGSISMDEEKQALQGLDGQPPVLAEFTDALLAELEGIEDFHVGVVSSDPGDWVLHTHRDYPAVPEGPDTACGLPPGQRFIVGPSDQLEAQFACIAATQQVEIHEETVHNAGMALAEPQNAGFLRDDSVLLVVLLSDEDTQGPLLQVPQREAILDAVGGRLDRVVVFAIVGDQGVFEMPKSKCYGVYGEAVPGRRISSIVMSFRDQGVVHDLCTGTLGDAFAAVLDDVVRTCEEFEPEG